MEDLFISQLFNGCKEKYSLSYVIVRNNVTTNSYGMIHGRLILLWQIELWILVSARKGFNSDQYKSG